MGLSVMVEFPDFFQNLYLATETDRGTTNATFYGGEVDRKFSVN